MLSKTPRYPLYIPTKGRHEYMITSKALTAMGIPHYLIVEPQEVDAYRVASRDLLADIVTLDWSFKERYQLCDEHGLSKSTGPGPARNCAWEHSIAEGHTHHWVMDDNIQSFMRYHHGMRVKTLSPAFFRAMEDFVLRYKNVAMAGPNYSMFAFGAQKLPPFILNTRIYSCNLIRNDIPFRWRGRYNEDTILSLDALKAGWCTIQFYAFLQQKLGTQVVKGGNTDEFYHVEGKHKKGQRYTDTGTLAKSKMLARVHPDIARTVWRFGRYHHHVNYRPFQKNLLLRECGSTKERPPNEYGLKLARIR